MTMTKLVNGERIEMTAEEEEALRATWAEESSLESQREDMVLTRYQARAALLNAGLLDEVEALMEDPGTPADVRLMWQHKERIRRTHPATVQMAGALGWTDEQVDDLFRAGMAIEP